MDVYVRGANFNRNDDQIVNMLQIIANGFFVHSAGSVAYDQVSSNAILDLMADVIAESVLSIAPGDLKSFHLYVQIMSLDVVEKVKGTAHHCDYGNTILVVDLDRDDGTATNDISQVFVGDVLWNP